MSNSTKKGFGVYATLVSAVLAIAAAVIYQVIGGKFGATQRVCYDQWVVLLLIGGGVVSGALVGLKKYGVAERDCRVCAVCRHLLLCAQVLLVCHRCVCGD